VGIFGIAHSSRALAEIDIIVKLFCPASAVLGPATTPQQLVAAETYLSALAVFGPPPTPTGGGPTAMHLGDAVCGALGAQVGIGSHCSCSCSGRRLRPFSLRREIWLHGGHATSASWLLAVVLAAAVGMVGMAVGDIVINGRYVLANRAEAKRRRRGARTPAKQK
jgi:hypothetical protein